MCVQSSLSTFNHAGANVNVRDYGGRRPVDTLNNKTTERARCKWTRNRVCVTLMTITRLHCSFYVGWPQSIEQESVLLIFANLPAYFVLVYEKDVLHSEFNWCDLTVLYFRSAALLCKINNHGLPTRVYTPDHLFTFSQPHQKDGRLHRNWSSVGDMVEKRVDHEKVTS